MKLLVASVAAVLVLGGGARGQEVKEWRPADALTEEGGLRPPARLEDRNNPSVEYFRIWDGIPNAQRRELAEAAGNASHEHGAKLDKNARRLLEEHRDYVDALIRNAGGGPCDWGINVEGGWGCTLPHLSFLRQSVRVIRMDAYRCIEDGSYAAAAERVAAIVEMSDHTRSDAVMISALVGAAMCSTGLNLTDEMVKDHQVSPASARLILKAVGALPREDIFGVVAAIERERYFSVDWVRKRYTGEQAGYLMMREVEGMGNKGDFFNRFIYGMNERRLGADLDRFGQYFEAVGAAWKKPDSVVRLNELSAEVAEGQFGLTARVMAPSVERVAVSIRRTREQIARTQGRLEAIVHTNDAGGAMDAGAAK